MIAGAGLGNNQGLILSRDYSNAVVGYQTTQLLLPLTNTVANSVAANILSNSTLLSLNTMASNTCPALADSTPIAYANTIGNIISVYQGATATPSLGNSIYGFTEVIATIGNIYLGSGNPQIFVQAFPAAQAFVQTTNDYVNTSYRVSTYLGSSFTSMNSLISGNLTDVNLATGPFGDDLKNLGLAIDLANLDNLGSPAALLAQIVLVTGILPDVLVALVSQGLTADAALSIIESPSEASDTEQRLIYLALESINDTNTPISLAQILTLLRVTTAGIKALSDLLNPYKMFPNSFQSLTVQTANGLRGIYVDAQGTVNSNLLQELPQTVLKTIPL